MPDSANSDKRWLMRNCYHPGSDVVFPTKTEISLIPARMYGFEDTTGFPILKEATEQAIWRAASKDNYPNC